MKKSLQWLKGLSVTKKVFLAFGALAIIGIATSGNQPAANLQTTNSANQTGQTQQLNVKPKAAVKADTITKQTVTETQSVPFTTTTVNDSMLAKGTTKVTTSGVDGVKTLTYEITYTNGVQTDKQLTSEEVTTQPVTQVTAVGTYVAPAAATSCPNGTYVNSSGDTVCSPYASSSAPAGATAQCVDGTYSFSESHSGTCSHHGGVAQWF